MSVRYHTGKFPPTNIDWRAIASPLAEASTALARYDSFLGIIPNPEILIAPLMIQEAVTSSRIEGTQATVGDVLEFNAGNTDVSPSKRDDIRKVVNYQVAVEHADQMMDSDGLPLCGRVLKSAHRILLSGVRGEMKSPGMYRTEQNWIGTPETRIEDAGYVPAPPDAVEGLMAVWEDFANTSDTIPPLCKVAFAHAEFESIHPFYDGNGRIGRMVVPLMLRQDGLLSRPCFFLSEFFEKRNDEYQDRLRAVSASDDWTGWCLFFLRAVRDQARDNYSRASGIYTLNQSVKSDLSMRSGSAYVGPVVDRLFQSSIFSASDFSNIDEVNAQTARRLLKTLEEMGVIRTLRPGRGRRAAIMIFPDLLKLTDGSELRGLCSPEVARRRYRMPPAGQGRDRGIWTLGELRALWGLGEVTGRMKTAQSAHAAVVPGPLGTRLHSLCRESADEWVLQGPRGIPMGREAVRDRFERLVRKAGVPRHPLRNLRNSWKTFTHWTLCVDPEKIERMMGHAGRSVTERHYDRPEADMLAAAVAEAYRAHPYADGWGVSWDELGRESDTHAI